MHVTGAFPCSWARTIFAVQVLGELEVEGRDGCLYTQVPYAVATLVDLMIPNTLDQENLPASVFANAQEGFLDSRREDISYIQCAGRQLVAAYVLRERNQKAWTRPPFHTWESNAKVHAVLATATCFAIAMC
jgi:hypothetical protein